MGQLTLLRSERSESAVPAGRRATGCGWRITNQRGERFYQLEFRLASLSVISACLVEGDAQSALRLFTDYSGRIDLVIADMVMTDTHGVTFVDSVKQLSAGTRVLLTGSVDDMPGHDEGEGLLGTLQGPPRDLECRALRAVPLEMRRFPRRVEPSVC